MCSITFAGDVAFDLFSLQEIAVEANKQTSMFREKLKHASESSLLATRESPRQIIHKLSY